MDNLKIAFIASSGGHLEEISRLKKLEKLGDSFLVTEKSDFVIKDFADKQYLIPQVNRRELSFPIKFLKLFIYARKLLKEERPDYIVTTGALIAYPFCIVGKKMGIKTVYVESFARVHGLSMTGKFLYGKTDMFIVQWEELQEKFPKSILGGGIF